MPSLNFTALAQNPRRMAAITFLGAFLLFFWSTLFSGLLWEEAREGLPVRFMLAGDSLLLPKVHASKIRTKPPLFHWSALALAKLTGGLNEISLRLPSVLAGAGAVALTALLGSTLFSPAAGWASACVLATSWQFAYLGTHARVDMLFAFFILLGFFFTWKGLQAEEDAGRRKAGTLAGFSFGCAVLAKGPLGLLYPLLALALYQLWERPGRIPYVRLAGIPLLMGLLWGIGAAIEGGETYRNMVYQETIARILGDSPAALHEKAFYYYLPQLFVDFSPWSVFLPLALWHGWQSRRNAAGWRYPFVLFATLFVMLSLFSGKRGDYLLPAYPMIALLIGAYGSEYLTGKKPLSPGILLPAFLAALSALGFGFLLIALGFGLLTIPSTLFFLSAGDQTLVQSIFATRLSPPLLGTAALMVIAYAAAMFLAIYKRKPLMIGAFFLLLAFSIIATANGPLAGWAGEYQSSRKFAAEVKKQVGTKTLLISGRVFSDLLYYVNLPVMEKSLAEAGQHLLKHPNHFLLIRDRYKESLLSQFPQLKVKLKSHHPHDRNYFLITAQ